MGSPREVGDSDKPGGSGELIRREGGVGRVAKLHHRGSMGQTMPSRQEKEILARKYGRGKKLEGGGADSSSRHASQAGYNRDCWKDWHSRSTPSSASRLWGVSQSRVTPESATKSAHLLPRFAGETGIVLRQEGRRGCAPRIPRIPQGTKRRHPDQHPERWRHEPRRCSTERQEADHGRHRSRHPPDRGGRPNSCDGPRRP